MRMFFAMLLTTLFVGAMPLNAAHAQEHACQSYSDVFETDDFKAATVEQHGTITDLKDEKAAALVARLTELSGPPPFQVDEVVVVSTPDGASVGLAYFNKNCLVGMGRMPTKVVLGEGI